MVNKLTKSKISFSEILKNVDELITKFSTLNFIVRDIDIQKELIKEIQTYLSFIKYCKTQAIERNDEQHANAFLGIQCLLNSAISSLKIWVHIKESYHYLAWNSLIDAHEYIDYALKTNHEHPLFNEIKQQLQKTEEIIAQKSKKMTNCYRDNGHGLWQYAGLFQAITEQNPALYKT